MRSFRVFDDLQKKKPSSNSLSFFFFHKVYEYMEGGLLLDYLRQCRPSLETPREAVGIQQMMGVFVQVDL